MDKGGLPTAMLMMLALGIALIVWLAWQARIKSIVRYLRAQSDQQALARETLSRKAHDGLIQGMQALILKFHVLAERLPPDAPQRSLMLEALDQAEETLIEGRSRIMGLIHNEPEDLRQIVQNCADDAASICGTNIVVEIEDGAWPFEQASVEPVGKTVCDAILHAARYAFASQIQITITYAGSALFVTIFHNGRCTPCTILGFAAIDRCSLETMAEHADRLAEMAAGTGNCDLQMDLHLHPPLGKPRPSNGCQA